MEREESLQRLEFLKNQLMELEHQYEKSKPLVQLVDNMVKLGSLYNRPGSTIERLERNQRLRQKVLAEHALEQQRYSSSRYFLINCLKCHFKYCKCMDFSDG